MDASATTRWPALPVTGDKKRSLTRTAETTSTEPSAEGSDEALMAQLGEGNSEVLAILFRRHARSVRSIAYRAVRDVSEADDLVQDIFLLVHRAAKAFDPAKGTARAWIFQIAHRCGISRYRYLTSRYFYQQVDLNTVVGELGDPQTTVQHEGSIQEMFGESDFDKAFANLSRDQRETLRLHFFEGYTFSEIAAELCQSRENIKHHYFRGLEKLRKRLFARELKGNETVR
jgi:RNA polymerase sigma-70 factor (ECF subfamily)